MNIQITLLAVSATILLSTVVTSFSVVPTVSLGRLSLNHHHPKSTVHSRTQCFSKWDNLVDDDDDDDDDYVGIYAEHGVCMCVCLLKFK